MKHITLATLLLAFSATFAVQKELGELFGKLQIDDKFEGKKVLAVLPFNTGEGVPADAGRTVSEFGVVNFHQSGRYQVVERDQFSKMLEEQELAQSDLVNEENQIKLGKLLVAERLLVGSVTESFGQRMINARIVDVTTGTIVASGTATVGPAAMDDFMKELLGEKGQVSATLIRSAVFPGWGQLYSNHPIRGGISMVAVLGGAGYAIFSWIQTLDALSDRNALKVFPDFNSQARTIAAETGENESDVYDRLVTAYGRKQAKASQKYSDLFDQTMIIWGVTGGLYVLNLVDATFAGLGAKKKFNLYFSAAPGVNGQAQLVYKF